MRILPDNWRFAFLRVAVVIVLIFIVNTCFVGIFRTFGVSMEPTVKNGTIVFINKLAYRHHIPDRGDIIIFRTSDRPYVYFLKRVIGLPGDIVEYKNGILITNGKTQTEPYLRFQGNWTAGPFRVKEGHVFAVGDNRTFDWNEQFHAEVRFKNITGRIIGYK